MDGRPDALDLLPDGVLIADRNGVRRVNDVAARLLGLTAEQACGRSLEDVLGLNRPDGCSWVDVNDPFGGLSTRSGIAEQAWIRPDGTEVLVSARLRRSARGGEVESVAVVLRSSRAWARMDRERSDLVATVAHELRSPLTGVKGFVHALLNRWDRLNDDQRRLMLTTVAADADRLSRLIAELLDVARLDTGRLRLNRRPTDLALKVERVVDSIAIATARPIELEVVERPMIDADPDKVTQVLTNLVENGVRHGQGTVRVVVRGPDHDGDAAQVEVTDEGDGVPADLRTRVFTKFWTGATGGGSGLGLYIVHGLVNAHGGSVTIGDAPSGGARVVTRWPMAAAAAAAADPSGAGGIGSSEVADGG